jgi:phosphoribosyl 1,2-cyclic phosphodiesterase
MYKIIASGSTGNAVLYHGSILVDCGVPFLMLREHVQNLQIVLFTHEHADHFNPITIKRLAKERPTLRFGCGKHLFYKLLVLGVKQRNIDVFEIGKLYDYGNFQISTIQLYHDIENIGYRIKNKWHMTIHCTDTATLEGITAKNYDLFALEHNYDEETIWQTIEAIESKGGFAHQRGAINSHLSEQQARNFFFENKGENSQLIRLHESKNK